MRAGPAEVGDTRELSERSGDARARLTTSHHLQDGNKDAALKDIELVDLDIRRP